jgi:hypothetical protein
LVFIKNIAISLIISTVLIGSETSVRANSESTLELKAEATQSTGAFKKFLYSWSIPNGSVFTSLTGNIQTQASSNSFNEALISLFALPKGTCPKNGELHYTYQEIRNLYPDSHRIFSNIIKKSTSGIAGTTVNLVIPHGLIVSHCVFIVLDGSTITGGKYTIRSDLLMHYSNQPEAVEALTPIALGDEFCFGMQRGCGILHSASGDRMFTQFSDGLKDDGDIVAVQGNASAAAFPSSLISRYSFVIPAGAWSVINCLYIVSPCPNEVYGKAFSGNQIPVGSKKIASMTLAGRAVQSVVNPINDNLSGAVIHKGDCFAHLSAKAGMGGIDSEYQITLFLRFFPKPSLSH